jgi:Fungal chitosanase of glycosyl hydrolase group 75
MMFIALSACTRRHAIAISYKPDPLTSIMLGDIPALFEDPSTQIIKKSFAGKKFMCSLPDGELYFDSKLALDLDGSPYWVQDRPDSQEATSNHLNDGSNLDSDIVNYFVLPGGFYIPHGINLGDIAVVIRGLSVTYACFGDVGPSGSLGEGSIALHRDLGNETVTGRETPSGGTANPKAGIDKGVVTIVFPGSGNNKTMKKGGSTIATSGVKSATSAAIGKPLFERLQRQATAYKNRIDI